MEYSNPTTIEITLRKDITFHNGEKFDADDVVFTINEIINPKKK
jgi:peptide/nickel transport system substrate-binding protein